MADNESDRSPLSSENSESNEFRSQVEAETGGGGSEARSKESEPRDNKEEDGDNKGAYTAATRGFPPSRFTPRGPSFGSSSHFGGNPFAVKSTVNKSESSQHDGASSQSWPGLTPSKLGGATAGATPSPRLVLRPPQLSSPLPPSSPAAAATSAATPSRSFPLNPSRLGNPSAKSEDLNETAEEGTSSCKPSTNGPKFMPLGTPSNAADSSNSSALTSTPTASCFVFGQNLHERVVESSPNHVSQAPSTSKQTENGTKEACCSSPTSNGTSTTSAPQMLFSAGLKKEQAQDSSNDSGGETPAKSLSEAAREYEESRAVKRKYEAVAVMTGEEDETNVLQISCKLYAYDTAGGSWAERGRGQLRLNDKVGTGGSTSLQSRLIMRTQGSLRLMLNTKVWAGMVVDRANAKSVRITAMDNEQIKVFLIQGSVKEADNLYTALERRVASQRVPVSCEGSTSPEREVGVEEARSGLEASSFPSTEPNSKKGRSSLSSDQEDAHDVEL